MMIPKPTQKTLLERAAQSDDGMIAAEGVAKTTIVALVRKGWIIVVPQTNGPDRLLITEAGRKVTPPPATPALPEATAKPRNKLDQVTELLAAPGGASIRTLMAATGWQAHSVRGAIAGALKKRGLVILSEKTEQGRVYRAQSHDQA